MRTSFKDPEDVCRQCLRGVRAAITDDQYIDAIGRIMSAIQDAFDLGHKAAGGSIVPDAMRGGTWDLVEIALDRNEVDAVGAAAERAATERWDPRTHRALVSFLDKINIFRKKP
jgi:hypothetical protein